MTDFATATPTLWPSQNDVALTAGQGKTMLETQHEKLAGMLLPNDYTISGFLCPASSVNLSIVIPLGTAYISGRYVTVPGGTTVTATASLTNFVFLKLPRDGATLTTGASFEVNTTGTPPADCVEIATMVASVGAITSTTDRRVLPTTITALTSGTAFVVPGGITSVYVQVFGASGGGGGGGGVGASPGGNAGAGGTTTFGALTANGGGAGQGGCGSTAVSGLTTPVQGTASAATVTITGGGREGGAGGPCQIGASPGLSGANGGYAADYVTTTPGATVTYAIGAAGTAGAAGIGATPGIAGAAGQAGYIVVSYK